MCLISLRQQRRNPRPRDTTAAGKTSSLGGVGNEERHWGDKKTPSRVEEEACLLPPQTANGVFSSKKKSRCYSCFPEASKTDAMKSN
ncbi:hypothetical protein Ddc_03790 [Ditylenchus destructor]|nr:hypothetical protein Ddc_03790 [Ditylenchus destructor]